MNDSIALKQMVLLLSAKTGLSVFVLIELAFSYARKPLEKGQASELYNAFCLNRKVPPELQDLALDYLSGRIQFRYGKNPSTGNRIVWVIRQHGR